MPLTIHHLHVSQSERLPWLCEELSIPYTLHSYHRAPLFAPPKYKALHPIGAAPVLTDDSDADNNIVLAESGACVEYIAHKYGQGRLCLKPEEEGYADFLYWFHFANATLLPAIMRVRMLAALSLPATHPVLLGALERRGKALAHLNARLRSTKWLAGEQFCAAEIMTLVAVTTLRQFASADLGEYPNVLRWMRDCADRPAYRRAMAKADSGLDVESQLSAEGPRLFEEAGKRAKV